MGARYGDTGAVGSPAPPKTLEALRGMIAAQQLSLSKRQVTLLRFMIENPGEAAFSTHRSIAAACGVSPNAVRQLTQHLGFENLREFRELFRQSLRDGMRRSCG